VTLQIKIGQRKEINHAGLVWLTKMVLAKQKTQQSLTPTREECNQI
jgi:hypothetical protein